MFIGYVEGQMTDRHGHLANKEEWIPGYRFKGTLFQLVI